MQLVSNSFAGGQKIPAQYAFGVPDPKQHVVWGNNRNPHLAWSGAPSVCEHISRRISFTDLFS
jgi:phosphatidylethanolamine-binding protein (PEBP) family uncharacterized protein